MFPTLSLDLHFFCIVWDSEMADYVSVEIDLSGRSRIIVVCEEVAGAHRVRLESLGQSRFIIHVTVGVAGRPIFLSGIDFSPSPLCFHTKPL